MIILLNKKIKNADNLYIGQTKKEFDVSFHENEMITTDLFKRNFLKNDISVLEDTFLGMKLNFKLNFYRYDYLAEIIGNNHESREKFETEFNEIMADIMKVYKRIYDECPKKREECLETLNNYFVIVDILNYALALNGNKLFDKNKYLSAFTIDKKLQEKLNANSLITLKELVLNKGTCTRNIYVGKDCLEEKLYQKLLKRDYSKRTKQVKEEIVL